MREREREREKERERERERKRKRERGGWWLGALRRKSVSSHLCFFSVRFNLETSTGVDVDSTMEKSICKSKQIHTSHRLPIFF